MDSGQDQNPVSSTTKPKNNSKKPILIAIALIILALIGIGVWKISDKNTSEPQTSTTTEEVLPPTEGTATMGVSTSAPQVTVGEVATFKVYVNPGETEVNAVGVRASFPTDNFELADINYEGSGFDIQAKEEVKNGVVTLDLGATKNLKGEQFVATITLKALKPSTDSGLTLNDGSILIQSSNNKNILKTWQGAQIKIVEE
jgi:hypothetical protein